MLLLLKNCIYAYTRIEGNIRDEREGEREREREKRKDGGTERRRDGESERRRDGETESRRDRETETERETLCSIKCCERTVSLFQIIWHTVDAYTGNPSVKLYTYTYMYTMYTLC